MVLHTCEDCDRQFTKTEHFKRHQRSHTKERPYQCNICQKAFSRSDVLFRHTKLHSDEQHNEITPSPTDSDPNNGISQLQQPSAQKLTPPQLIPAKRPADHDGQPLPAQQYDQSHPAGLGAMTLPSLDNAYDGLRSDMSTSSPIAQHRPHPLGQMMTQQLQQQQHQQQQQQQQQQFDQQLNHSLLQSHSSQIPQQLPDQISQQMMQQLPQQIIPISQLPPQMQLQMTQPSSQAARPAFSRNATGPTLAEQNGPGLPSKQAQNQGLHTAMDMSAQNDALGFMNDNFDPSLFEGSQVDMVHSWLNQADNDIDLSTVPLSNFSGPLQYSRFSSAYQSPTSNSRSESGSMSSIPESRFARVEDVWRAKAAKSYCFRDLWQEVASSQAVNIFCCDNLHIASDRATQPSCGDYGLSHSVRDQLKSQFGMPTPPPPGRKTKSNTNSHGGMSNFPPSEVLGFSLDIFFRRMAPMIPFIHIPTFSAVHTPPSLLFALCILGLSTTNSAGGSKFLKKAFFDLRRQAMADIVATASTTTTIEERISAYAISFLVLQLAIFSMDMDMIEQSQSLHSMLLSIATRQGLFAAPEALTAGLLRENMTEEQKWHAWARVESVRRLVSCMITSDWWWGNNTCASPIIHAEAIIMSLPADDELFNARTSSEWWSLVQNGRNLDMPTIIPRSLHLKGATDSVLLQPHAVQPFTMFSVLTVLKHMVSDTHHRFFAQMDDWNGLDRLVPWKAFRLDFRAMYFVSNVVTLAQPSVGSSKHRNLNVSVLWHNLNINLTANLQIFELAAGRAGAARGIKALGDVSEWCKLAQARRAIIHAAQTYKLVSNRKVSDVMSLNCLSALFSAALVLGLYVFQTPSPQPLSNGTHPVPFDLMNDVDWTLTGDCGLIDPVTNPVQMYDAHHRSAVTDFINFGAPIALNGVPSAGYISARRILLDFAHLMDDMGAWKPKMFSRILHIMSDVLEDIP